MTIRQYLLLAAALVLLGAFAAYRYQDVLIPWIEGRRSDAFILVSGNIEAHESVLSFKTVQSRIVELPFDEGQTVKAGTVLARVDDADYKQQAEIAEAALERADAPARRRRAERRRGAPDRRQRRSGRRAEAARVRPRADAADQGRRHHRRARCRRHGAQTVARGARARQSARGRGRQERGARHRQHRQRAEPRSISRRSCSATRR